jgi:two-component system sensor histidine kinase UhpB
MGLALAVRTMAEDFAARNGMSLMLDVPEDIDSLAPEIEHGYYRVAQEALENIAQHAGAQQVRVKLNCNNGLLYLEVADDGKGFEADISTSEQQFGLQGMRERAELIGAKFEVKSAMDGGSMVQLSMEK